MRISRRDAVDLGSAMDERKAPRSGSLSVHSKVGSERRVEVVYLTSGSKQWDVLSLQRSLPVAVGWSELREAFPLKKNVL